MGPKNQVTFFRQAFYVASGVSVVLAVACLMLVNSVQEASQMRRIFLPPQLRVSQVIDGHAIPAPTVYAFTVSIFQQLHRWSQDGEKDYPDNVRRLGAFLTHEFKDDVKEDINKRRGANGGAINELSHRQRGMSLPADVPFSDDRVKELDDGSWVVTVDFDVRETFNNMIVKDIRVRYPLTVVRHGVDWEKNPWGLAISGFGQPGPKRLDEEAIALGGKL